MMTSMMIGYAEFVRLFRVDEGTVEDWEERLSVEKDGVYVCAPPPEATPEEQAALSAHPTGNLEEPILRFPCSLQELEAFADFVGLRAAIDPFLLVAVLDDSSIRTKDPAPNSKVYDALAALIVTTWSQSFLASLRSGYSSKAGIVLKKLERHEVSVTAETLKGWIKKSRIYGG